ncbi:MAG: hypothetical protein R2867_36150 [Caldilineaceae bacterium]
MQQLHESLTAHASVCNYCGVGCSYAVVTAPNGNQKVTPLSDLGLCVKGETSLLTGGDHRTIRSWRGGGNPATASACR